MMRKAPAISGRGILAVVAVVLQTVANLQQVLVVNTQALPEVMDINVPANCENQLMKAINYVEQVLFNSF